jgi:prolyl-tRNA editing enzyme YbaK/EbsC (Cys-tRNA(Pro) deacylase)
MTESTSDTSFPPQVQKVLATAESAGIECQMRHYDAPGKTAQQAADLLGCPLGAIVKSLVFQGRESGEMALVLVSGQNRADSSLLEALFGEAVKPASPADVFAWSGFRVGAVPPFGIDGDFSVLMDADLFGYEEVWASGGSDFDLMKLTPAALWAASGAEVKGITEA